MTRYGALAVLDPPVHNPPACREQSPDPCRVPRTEEAARRADALARSLCAAREAITAPLARIAASLVRERAWCLFGFARAADFARERLGRSGRWLRDLASLHQAFSVRQMATSRQTRAPVAE